jgi:hypothetical protein
MFNWTQSTQATQAELDNNGISTFDTARHMRSLQRAGHRLLVELRKVKPQLVGQPSRSYETIVDVVVGLQAARHDRRSSTFETGVRSLESLVLELIHSKPVQIDLSEWSQLHVMGRTQLLFDERDKCGRLLVIPNFEVSLTAGNSYDRQSANFGYQASQGKPDVEEIRFILNRLHFLALELFLEHFAADLTEEEIFEEAASDRQAMRAYQMFS